MHYSQLGWNVMPTAGKAKDHVAYKAIRSGAQYSEYPAGGGHLARADHRAPLPIGNALCLGPVQRTGGMKRVQLMSAAKNCDPAEGEDPAVHATGPARPAGRRKRKPVSEHACDDASPCHTDRERASALCGRLQRPVYEPVLPGRGNVRADPHPTPYHHISLPSWGHRAGLSTSHRIA